MDLSTTYLGFDLPHPLMVGAGPLADRVDSVKRLEEAGAAAVVMRSLFQEQVEAETLAAHRSTEPHSESFAEATSYFPDHHEYVLGPDDYLEQIARLKEVISIPLFASLNGATPGGWLDYAKQIEQAGADALELNTYHVAANADESGEEIERRIIEMVASVRRTVRIPIAVKLSASYTAMANFARQLEEAGADGLVLFNRFFEPDIDLEELEVVSHLELSDPSELLLRLRWLAILSGRVDTSLAVTGGVHATTDVIKAVMCGADAVQLVSALLKNGPDYLSHLHRDLGERLREMEYESLEQMRGSMNLLRCPDPTAFERANYVQILQTWR